MRIVLDTGVLWRPAAIRDLATSPHEIVLPAVAFAERLRQLAGQGRPPGPFEALIARMGITVEPFGKTEARRFVPRLTDDDRWRRLARDAMIAGHVGPDDVLWTTNPKDFHALGVPGEHLVEVP